MSLHTNTECWLWLHEKLDLNTDEGPLLGVEMVGTKTRELIAASMNHTVFLAVTMPRTLAELGSGIPSEFTLSNPLFAERLMLARELQVPLALQREQAGSDILKARAVESAVLPHREIPEEELKDELSIVLLEQMAEITRQVFAATDFEVFRAAKLRP
jgi:hypothetical protein